MTTISAVTILVGAWVGFILTSLILRRWRWRFAITVPLGRHKRLVFGRQAYVAIPPNDLLRTCAHLLPDEASQELKELVAWAYAMLYVAVTVPEAGLMPKEAAVAAAESAQAQMLNHLAMCKFAHMTPEEQDEHLRGEL